MKSNIDRWRPFQGYYCCGAEEKALNVRGVDHKAERFVAGYGTTLQWVLIKNRFLFPCSESTIPFWLSALLYLSSSLSASPSCAASSVTDAGCTNEGTLNSTKVSKRTAGIPYVVSPSVLFFNRNRCGELLTWTHPFRKKPNVAKRCFVQRKWNYCLRRFYQNWVTLWRYVSTFTKARD